MGKHKFNLSTLSLFIISVVIDSVHCHLLTLEANHEECFYERLKQGSKIKFSFEVLSDGSLDVGSVDLAIKDPNNYVIHSEQQQTSGRYTIEANQDGPHTYCFGNKFSQVPKMINYNVDINTTNKDTNVEHDRLSDMVTELVGLVTGAKHETDFLAARDRLHRVISERINSNLNIWSLIEFVIMLSFAIGQTYYIKRFFEVRRRV